MRPNKCLIMILSAMFVTAAMYAQQATERFTAEQQLAQRKAALDAREKALNEREKTLAKREKAIATSALRSGQKARTKTRQEQAKTQSAEEQAKAARAEKKLHEPFAQQRIC